MGETRFEGILEAMGGRLVSGYLLRNPIARLGLRALDTAGALTKLGRRRPPPDRPARVLLVQMGHLGDVILMLGVLPSVRRVFPDAELDVLCGSWSRPLLEGHGEIHTLETLDHPMLARGRPWGERLRRYVQDRCRVRCWLADRGHAVALEMRAYFPNSLPLLSGASPAWVCGFGTGGFGHCADAVVPWREEVHETDHFLDVVRASSQDPQVALQVSTPSLSHLLEDRLDEALELLSGEPHAIVHPGAGNPAKLWDIHGWRRVVAGLETRGLRVAVTGSAEERPLAEAVSRGSRAAVLAGRTTLPQLVRLVHGSQGVLAVDSLAAHLGGASGQPTVVLANGIESMIQWRPLGPRVRMLMNPVPCAPCYRKNGCGPMTCMGTRPEAVLAAWDELSRRTNGPSDNG